MNIIIILDRSGSMASIKSDVEGGFDSFVADQRKEGKKKTTLTLVQFDSEAIETVYERKLLADVPSLALEPRGMTPLLDAVGSTIAKSRDTYTKKTLVVIITDGMENASHEYKKDAVKAAIEDARKKDWEFIYLGANVDAFAEAGQMGIPVAAAAVYTPDTAGVKAMYCAASSQARSYLRTGKIGFTDEDRKSMESK